MAQVTDIKKDVVSAFLNAIKHDYSSNVDVSVPVAAIQALNEFLCGHSQARTMSEFIRELEGATVNLKEYTNGCISVAAGCELFTRFVTRTAGECTGEDFQQFRQKLMQRIDHFGRKSLQCRDRIAELAMDFIQDDTTILLHSHSRVVMSLLLRAAARNRRFRVLVTEARPTCQGGRAARLLREAGIPATIILDSAVGFYIERVDMVLVGAEGVVENGGIINQIGTYLIAVMAKSANVPFYAVVENYKFVRCFPLNQNDLPTMSSSIVYTSSTPLALSQTDGNATNKVANGHKSGNVEEQRLALSSESLSLLDQLEPDHPTIDYTPPHFISLLFTDVGVLTPSAVSDELIKLYF